MGNLLRLSAAAVLIAAAILVVAVGLAKNNAALLGPAHFFLFIAAVVLYLLPTGIAMYRDCEATGWIATVNILLGWTVIGWLAAMGWAAAGRIRMVPPSPPAAPHSPVPGH